jgi:hypothetical protein
MTVPSKEVTSQSDGTPATGVAVTVATGRWHDVAPTVAGATDAVVGEEAADEHPARAPAVTRAATAARRTGRRRAGGGRWVGRISGVLHRPADAARSRGAAR